MVDANEIALRDRYTFDRYATFVASRDGMPDMQGVCMGLAGEVGELVDYMKKVCYHGKPFDKDRGIDEAGDVLWYLQAFCNRMGVSIQDLMAHNEVKLTARYPKGFAKGGGTR
jgi:NTP pyrophosphatase (non-canonical NTP hydrolase)